MEEKIKQCPEFPFFGALYPDARCCDGYLWDLDSYDSEVGGIDRRRGCPLPFLQDRGVYRVRSFWFIIRRE